MIMRDIDDSTEQNRSFITGIAGRKGYTVITLSKRACPQRRAC